MKKLMMIALCVMVFATLAMAQTYTEGTGITGIDKLGAHQNGGRGCVGCHAPHSGARGNGGTLTWKATFDGVTKKWNNQTAVVGNSGEDALWGQDLGPVLGLGTITSAGGYAVDLSKA